jgi:hypothetical protein
MLLGVHELGVVYIFKTDEVHIYSFEHHTTVTSVRLGDRPSELA